MRESEQNFPFFLLLVFSLFEFLLLLFMSVVINYKGRGLNRSAGNDLGSLPFMRLHRQFNSH